MIKEENTILCPFDNGIRVMQQFNRGVYGSSKAPQEIFRALFPNGSPKNIIDVDRFNTGKNEDSYKGHSEITSFISKFKPPFYVLGGDHSITYPIVKGLTNQNKKKYGLIYFDAHYDLRPLEGPNKDILSSGNSFNRIVNDKDLPINGENMVVIGIKKSDSEIFKTMTKIAEDNKMTTFYIDQINENTCEDIMKKAIEIASRGTDGYYLSFDIDVIEAKDAPGCSCPANEVGLSLEIAKKMVKIGKFIAGDIVEASNRLKNYKGEEDKEGDNKLKTTAATAAEIIKCVNFQ